MRSEKLIAPAAIMGLAVAVAAMSAAAAAPTKAEIQKAFEDLAGLDYGKNRDQGQKALWTIDAHILATRGNRELRGAIERELIRIVESDAAFAAKQAACRRLLIVGSDASVPALSKLLASKDHKLVEAACLALSGRPTPKVTAALRKALDGATGRRGPAAIITLLGDMRDAGAVERLARMTRSKERIVSDAAADALGKIASDDAVAALKKLLSDGDEASRTAAAAALLQAAGQLAARDNAAGAVAICKLLGAANTADYIRRGAFAGRLRWGRTDAVDELIAALKGNDRAIKATAISLIPSIPGKGVTSRAAGQLGELAPEYRRLLVRAIGRRGGSDALGVLLKATADSDTAVRVAAIQFIGRLGDKTALEVLFKLLGDKKPELRKAAQGALRIISGDGIETAILAKMMLTRGQVSADLIRILVERRCGAVLPAALEVARRSDVVAGKQAIRGLRIMGGRRELPDMIKLLDAPACANLRGDLENAIAHVARRPGGPETVLDALKNSDRAETRTSLITVLGKLGDRRGYAAVKAACRDTDKAVKDAAIRALVAWPDPAAADDVLRIAENADCGKWRILALRGYIRLIALDRKRPVGRTLDMYEKALKLSARADEKKLILAGLASVPHKRSLEMIEPLKSDPKLAKEVKLAEAKIRKALGRR